MSILEELNERGAGKRPGLIGLEVPRGCDEGNLVMRLELLLELREGLLCARGFWSPTATCTQVILYSGWPRIFALSGGGRRPGFLRPGS